MAKYRVTGPDGKSYEVTAPEGASEQDIMNYVQSQVSSPSSQPVSGRAPLSIPLPPDRPAPSANPIADDPKLRAFMGATSKDANIARIMDPTVRALASGATFGAADNLAAAASTATGVGGQPGATYDQNLAAEYAKTDAMPPETRLAGELIGAGATGAGLARAGVSLLRGARATVPSLVTRGAVEGGAYGAAHGFGHGRGQENRATGALENAMLGAVTGGATGVFARAATRKLPENVTRGIRDKAKAAYAASEKAGVIVKADSVANLTKNIQQQLAEAGIDASLHPKALAAFNRLQQAGTENQTLSGLDIVRQVIKDVGASPDAGERRLARIMVNSLDDYIAGLGGGDVLTGSTSRAVGSLRQARQLWMRASKGDIIGGLMERAGNRAGQFTGSGYENALRTEFRGLAQNAAKMRGFTVEEQDLIRRVARGGPLGNALRWVGKLAPRGIVSMALSGGAGAAIGGAPGAVALPLIGEVGRAGATAITSRSAKKVLEKVTGVTAKPVVLSPAEIAALRTLLIGETQGGQAVLNRNRE